MPLPATLLVVATLLPLVGFLTLVVIGKRLGTPLAGVAGTLFVSLSFICSLWGMIVWIGGGGDAGWGYQKLPIITSAAWLPIEGLSHAVRVGIYIDSLTIVMFATVTLIATIVHVFSIRYLRGDERFSTYFAYLGLFCFAMLALVLAASLLQVYIFWELVGLCSYLLIGFWFQRRAASAAAIKAFVMNRIGDMLMLIGIGIVLTRAGDTLWPTLWTTFDAAANSTWLTLAGVCLLFGAIGKSAQFPLQTWLPDAMEGPSPVSALIHAATMVAAGVYLAARLFPLLTPDAKLFLAIIGCTTLTLGALCAVAQSDIKRVLAYSTISQLGYMMLAIGVGSWVGGLFHLITHAFFKALLFLAAGSVIYATHHQQKLRHYGGLWRKMPITCIVFAVGVLAIAGFGYGGVGFAGFYSKEMILTHAAAYSDLAVRHDGSILNNLFFWLPVGVSYLTAFYMGRVWVLTFLGTPRDEHVHAAAHESPTLWVPLAVLATLSIVGGTALSIVELLTAGADETRHICQAIDPGFGGMDRAWPAHAPETGTDSDNDLLDHTPTRTQTPSQMAHVNAVTREHRGTAGGWAWLIGLAPAWLIYRRGFGHSDRAMQFAPLRGIRNWLHDGMYFDLLYNSVFAASLHAVSGGVELVDRFLIDPLVNAFGSATKAMAFGIGTGDRYVVDGAVTALVNTSQRIGAAVRRPDAGRVRVYVTVMMAASAVAFAAGAVYFLVR